MPGKEPIKYWDALEVREIADELIPQFHTHLSGETILYIFRSEHAEENGKPVLGKAKKASGLNAYLAFRQWAEDEFEGDVPASFLLMEIAHDTWQLMSPAQRVALVDHELCHYGKDGMRSHDVEEFRAVIDRHGLWRPEIEAFAATMAQQKLFPTSEDHADRVAKKFSEELRTNPKVREKLRPKKGSGIDKVSITTPDGTVDLEAH